MNFWVVLEEVGFGKLEGFVDFVCVVLEIVVEDDVFVFYFLVLLFVDVYFNCF